MVRSTQGAEVGDSAAKFIGAGAAGSGNGIGSVFGSLINGYAHNPSLKQQLLSSAILGFALSEAMGLFCLMMACLLLFAYNTFCWLSRTRFILCLYKKREETVIIMFWISFADSK